jgi:hypothetical protein
MVDNPTTSPEPTDDSERGRRFEAVLGAYFEALDAGQSPDRQELLTRHPDLAAELAEFFAEQDRFHRLVAPQRPESSEPGAAASAETQDHSLAGMAGISRRCRLAMTVGILAMVIAPEACAPRGPESAPLSKEAKALLEKMEKMRPPRVKKSPPRHVNGQAGGKGRASDPRSSPRRPAPGHQ